MSWGNYRERDTKQERADIEREIKQAVAGFAFLREFPEFSKAVRLAKEINKLLPDVPDTFAGWKDQVERASVSTCCNVAEAVGRGTVNQLAQYMRVAKGSAYEVLALLLICPVECPANVREMGQDVCRDIDVTVKGVAEERLSRL